MKISKSGHAQHEDEDTQRIFETLDGFNMRSFFSLNNKDKILPKQYKIEKEAFFQKVRKMEQIVQNAQIETFENENYKRQKTDNL